LLHVFLPCAAGVKGPGLSGVLMRIPGMKYITATPNWTPEDVGLTVGHGTLDAVPEGKLVA